jgi:hypothetical protein
MSSKEKVHKDGVSKDETSKIHNINEKFNKVFHWPLFIFSFFTV